MRTAIALTLLLVGCPAADDVAAVYTDSGADVPDAGGEDAGEADAGAPVDVDVGDGEPVDEPDPLPEPTPTLELGCGPLGGGLSCPTWVQGFDGTLECSPEGACSIRCDVLVPCRPDASTRGPDLAEAWRECQRKDATDPVYRLVDEQQAACASLGGVCGAVSEWPKPRSWCLPAE